MRSLPLLPPDDALRSSREAVTASDTVREESIAGVEKVKAALAEAGWPDAQIRPYGFLIGCAPDEVMWRAYRLSGVGRSCWPCFEGGGITPDGKPCDHDWRTEPWPPVVRP